MLYSLHLTISFLIFSFSKTSFSGDNLPKRRVFCGEPQDLYIYPFNSQAVLRYTFPNSSRINFCGGVLVHKSIVLTVNSCFDGIPSDALSKIEIRYGGPTYDTMIHYRFAIEKETHPDYDAALLMLNAYATENISYFDHRFWNQRPYERLCKTFLCGFGLTNEGRADDEGKVKTIDSGRMFCIRYEETINVCDLIDFEYRHYTECHYPASHEAWPDLVANWEHYSSWCYHDKGTPIFMDDEDGYVKLKGIAMFDGNCGNFSQFPNHIAPDVGIQIEKLAPWIIKYTDKKFPDDYPVRRMSEIEKITMKE